MPEEFVSLATMLRAGTPRDPCVASVAAGQAEVAAQREDRPHDETLDALAGEVRWFRARLAEAFDAALARLLDDLACDVLARELALASADIAAIAAAVLERAADESPVAIRVYPDDAAALIGMELPVTRDQSLRPGDLMVDLRDGQLDASLGVRLDGILRCSR